MSDRSSEGAAGLGWFNGLPAEAALAELMTCCSSRAWAESVAGARRYESVAEIVAASDRAVAEMSVADLGEALARHPRIGERAGAEHGRAAGWSRSEQAGVGESEIAVQHGLAEGNAAYEERFGHIYLVCAAGRSGAELLEVLQRRLGNDAEAEWEVVREELGQINALRLRKLLGEARPGLEPGSQ